MPKILIVEDDRATVALLKKYLEFRNYSVGIAYDAYKALEMLSEDESYDLVLMDILLPGMNGINAAKAIKENDYPVTVIIISAFSDEEFVSEAVAAGADDFLIKPIKLDLLETRINLARKANSFSKYRRKFIDALKSKNDLSRQTIDSLMADNADLSHEIMMKLYVVADYETRKNNKDSTKIGWIAGRLAEMLNLAPDVCATIQFAAPLKDIGFIGVNDGILSKPSKLTSEETEIMRKHVEIGRDILGGSSSGILKMAASIAYAHHERYDGSGYPLGLKGDEIPLEGQIGGIADTLDAMVTWRPYKEKKNVDDAFIEIVELKSKNIFKSEIVEALLTMKSEIKVKYER